MLDKNPKTSSGSWKDNFIAASLLIIYGMFFLFLYVSRKIIYFVHPDYAFLALFTAIFLFILALFKFSMIFHKVPPECTDGCSDTNLLNKKRNVIFLLLPFFLSIIFPIKPLSSATAELRAGRYNQDAGLSRSINTSSGFSIKPENRTLMDWIRLFSQDPEPDHYKGQKVKIVGFVFKDNTLSKDYFLISRFVLSCCAADARPIGIPVRYNAEKFHLEENQWIEIQGTFDSGEVQSERQPVIILQNYKTVPVPENPYAE